MTTTEATWPDQGEQAAASGAEEAPVVPVGTTPAIVPLDIPDDDPLMTYLQNVSGVVDVEKLTLDSPGVQALREADVRLVLPLVSQGELVGMINLGYRLSEQDYSSDDRRLLGNLATQAAPAVRVAQLVRQQQLEALERQRIEQELRVARLIQQFLLPKEVPYIPGWEVSAYYQPARAVGGDFYDFFHFPDGRIGFVIGDVTDKGVPAALVMATTRTLLRAAAEQLVSPGPVLERTNELLHEDIPPKMFVTCLYALLDPRTGELVFANAGHDLPYHRSDDGVVELRARGMPLGLMPGMEYEEKQATLGPDDCLLLYSDGLVEAHNTQREMFGFPKVQALMGEVDDHDNMITFLLEELADFTGPDWEQEDDVTMVLLQASPHATDQPGEMRTLTSFELPSRRGNEREAMERVAAVIMAVDLPEDKVERLKTAVAEATMNAMEHGNEFQEDVPVVIEVATDDDVLAVSITDKGGGQVIPDAETPDLQAKLAGDQSPRGWGLFLIQNMVDDVQVEDDDQHHTVTLIVDLNEGENRGTA